MSLTRKQQAARELLARRRAKEQLLPFIQYTNPDYQAQWFHRVITCHLDKMVRGEVMNLMLFVPPQHGKSEIASRRFPAFYFGRNPDLKVIHASYAADLIQGMNRIIQRTIDSDEYRRVFKETTLNGRNVRTVSGSWLRNNDEFEIIGRTGRYSCAGVGGGITGKPADLGIIDDPIKGYAEAVSKAVREMVWNWYYTDFLSRTHDHTRKVLIMTRWHADDLAGRLLKSEREKWCVVKIPALCEDPDAELRLWREVEPTATKPPRNEGDALWEDRFSRQTLEDRRRLNPFLFQAVYQQDPRMKEGNLFKYEGLPIEPVAPEGTEKIVRFWDLGGSDSAKADYSVGVLMTRTSDGILWVLDVQRGQWSPNERNERIHAIAERDRAKYGSRIKTYIERGVGLAVEVTDAIVRRLAGYRVEVVSPKGDKETRADPFADQCAARNVRLVQAPWNDSYREELTLFPNDAHDDQVDATSGAFSRLVAKQTEYGVY